MEWVAQCNVSENNIESFLILNNSYKEKDVLIMKEKMYIAIISSFCFYLFLILHRIVTKIHGDDWILQVLFYTALGFSIAVLEESIRKRYKNLRSLTLIDFSLKIFLLFVYFGYLLLDFERLVINAFTIVVIVLNVAIQYKMFQSAKQYPSEKVKDTITSKQIDQFIKNYYYNKLETTKLGSSLTKELNEIMSVMQISERENIIGIISVVVIFASIFVYKYYTQYMLVAMTSIVILVVVFMKFHADLIRSGFSNESNIAKKVVIENTCISIGYLILFLTEVIFKEDIGILRVSLLMLSASTFYPVVYRKYKLREKLKSIINQYEKPM